MTNIDYPNIDYPNRPYNYNYSVYEPQNLLGNWMLVSFFFVTTSLLFYNMTKEKLLYYPWFGLLFALYLMFVAISFILFSLYVYYKRMNNILNNCKNSPKELCSTEQYYHIKNLRDIYTYLTLLIITVKSIIVYFLLFHIYRKKLLK